MLRRFSPFQLVFALVVVALWGIVLFDRESCEVVRRHARAMVGPRSFDYSLPSEPTTRVDLQMIDAGEDRDMERLGALVEANPSDAALLAFYVRSNQILPRIYEHQVGPLVSPFPAWSVQTGYGRTALVGAPPPAPVDIATSTTVLHKPFDMTRFLALVARGQQLEPQNSYWDWMEMGALVTLERETELDAIVHRAALKPTFDDHTADELRARITYSKRQRLAFVPGTMVWAVSGIPLPHLSLLTQTSRYLAQRVMGLRLQGRDEEALQLGLDAMRLARQIRLQATFPITSHFAAHNEGLLIQRARVPLGRLAPLKAASSPLSTLASDPTSLLFLAKTRSPVAATEIASEWRRTSGWRGLWTTSLFGGLVARRTMLGVGWAMRGASFFAASLPVALIAWGAFVLCGRKQAKAPVAISRSLTLWGAGFGIALLIAFLVFDWFISHSYSPEPESWLVLFPSSLSISRVAWGGVVLWLIWVALWVRPKAKPSISTSKRRIEDWEMPLLESLPFRLLDWTFDTLKWGTKAVVPLVLGMLFIGGASLTLLSWPDDRGLEPLWSAQHPFFLMVSLGLLPFLWVWGREKWHWVRNKQRLQAQQVFVARARLLLGGYLMVALLLLPVFIWAQSRFERDFARDFAPIERGQMVSTIQKMRGIPMQ